MFVAGGQYVHDYDPCNNVDQRQKRPQICLDASLALDIMKEVNLSGVAEEDVWDSPVTQSEGGRQLVALPLNHA